MASDPIDPAADPGATSRKCEDCGRTRPDVQYRWHFDARLCESCCDTRSEAAYHEACERYYGSAGPVTDAERSQDALAQKRRLS